MCSLLAVERLCVVAPHAHLRGSHAYARLCVTHYHLFVLRLVCIINAVKVYFRRLLHRLCRVFLRHSWHVERGVAGFAVVGASHGVVEFLYRVEVVTYLCKALRAGVVGNACHVGEVESAVEVKHYALRRESLAAVRHAGASRNVLRPHVLKPLSAVERQQQVFLLRR